MKTTALWNHASRRFAGYGGHLLEGLTGASCKRNPELRFLTTFIECLSSIRNNQESMISFL